MARTSKLFTPSLNITTSAALREKERDEYFLNPPTHADIPWNTAPTDGVIPTLKLGRSQNGGNTNTTAPEKRRIKLKDHIPS